MLELIEKLLQEKEIMENLDGELIKKVIKELKKRTGTK